MGGNKGIGMLSISKKVKVWERILGGTEYGEECRYGLALNEILEGITENRDLPK